MEKYLAQASKYNYLILFGLAIFSLLGMGIILWNYNATEDSIKYFNTPNFPIWLLLMTIFTGLLPVLGIPLWTSLHPFRGYIKKHLRDIVISSIFLYGLFMASIPYAVYIIQLDFPLFGHVTKMAIIFTLGFFAVLPAAIGLWSIIDASRIAYDAADPDPKKVYSSVLRFHEFRDYLRIYLVIAGILISLVVLSTGAMQNALIDFDPEYEKKFTENIVLMHGLYFSFLLALIYVPSYTVYQYYGRRVRDKVYQVTTLEEHKAKADLRKELEDLLDLKITVGQNLRAGLILLAPLLTSLVSSLVNIKI